MGNATACFCAHCGQNPADNLVVSRGLLKDFPSRKHCDQFFVRKDHQALPAEPSAHPDISLRIGSRKQPPLEPILVAFLRINERS